MLDLRLIRDNPHLIEEGLIKRGLKVNLYSLQLQAQKLKEVENQRSTLQAQSNSIGKKVGLKIKDGVAPNSPEIMKLREEGNKIKKKVAELDEKQRSISAEIRDQVLNLPNIPSKNCPTGEDESKNKEIRKWGTPRSSDELKEHWIIASELKLIDFERSTRIAKSRFITLLNQGARLERALINFMIDIHVKNGYKEILPPVLINTESLTGSGQLPKFADESFRCSQDDLWLSPTSEVPITSFHRDEIVPFENLPLKYVAYSPCFRREAGSYGRDTKGLIRLHQFNKVELYWFCDPEKSQDAHESITSDAEDVLKKLQLPYRVMDLCTGDLGFSAKRTYDLEVWLPGAKKYREISSCSICGDFQSRRSSIRTKSEKGTKLVHTLNGSALAIGRTMAAILENGQQSDGSVSLPEALVPYFGKEKLTLV